MKNQAIHHQVRIDYFKFIKNNFITEFFFHEKKLNISDLSDNTRFTTNMNSKIASTNNSFPTPNNASQLLYTAPTTSISSPNRFCFFFFFLNI